MIFLVGLTAMSSHDESKEESAIEAIDQKAPCTTIFTICDAAWPGDSNYNGFDRCMVRNGCG